MDLLTVHEAAEALRVHEATIRRLVRKGGVEHLRVRGYPSETEARR
jgi:excisionase family DNA binding protein